MCLGTATARPGGRHDKSSNTTDHERCAFQTSLDTQIPRCGHPDRSAARMPRSRDAGLDVRQHAALLARCHARRGPARTACAVPFQPAHGARGALRGDRLRRRAPLHDVVRAARCRSGLRQLRLVPQCGDRRPAGGAELLRRGRAARTGHLLPRHDDLHGGRDFAHSRSRRG